jgi:hypothetical protein
MVSSGMLHRVALVVTDVAEEPGTSFIRVTRIGELGTTQAATSNQRTLRRNTFTTRFVPRCYKQNPLTLKAVWTPCKGELEYFHHSPASRKRRQKANPVSNETVRYGDSATDRDLQIQIWTFIKFFHVPSAIHRFQESLWFSEEGSIEQHSYRVWNPHVLSEGN